MAQNFLSNIQLGAGTYLRLGDSPDELTIFRTGSISQIRNETGDLHITNHDTDGDIVFYADDGTGLPRERLIIDGGDGSVSLNHYENTQLTTTSTGVTVTGDILVGDGSTNMKFMGSGTASNIQSETDDASIQILTKTGGSQSISFKVSPTLTSILTSTTTVSGILNFQKTGFTTITGSSNTFNINFATETNNYQFTLDNAACTIAFANLSANVVGKSGNIIITNPSSVGSLSVGNLPSAAYSPGGATVSWDTNASSVSILSYFILASDKVLINYVGNFKSYGT
jgi:hypothetical protein